ncbi:competence/damage-inducible protein A [Beijerinckia mobilis]|uniref:competence/damage-inducible protein A n=1 Tax=Beijerinckia mobilis TaxID=231434 RepID=UPI00055069A5|nr:molybdopterin-binding protein [Beijerinckia mobilis]
MTQQKSVTAALLVIGDEILSGRTKDQNIGFTAEFLTGIGIDLAEVRVVPDQEAEIIAAVNALRIRYDYLFTTGGIGPTHDDITADSVARALGVEIIEDPRAIALLLEIIKPENLNEARRRMARIPRGAELVDNPISKAPGFWIENVIVMAGVPSIMQAMLKSIVSKLVAGVPTVAETILAGNVAEGTYAADLARLASDYPQVSIGSYPHVVDGKFHNQIVVRGKDAEVRARVVAEVRDLITRLSAG